MIRQVEKILTQGGIEKSEARAEAELIVTEISGLKIEKILILSSGEEFSDSIKAKILNIAEQRIKTKAPIQHILGFAYFMGDKFFVDKNVLIPRPETELLVNCAAKIGRKITSAKGFQGPLNILDIGTGCGCIPIEISKSLSDVPLEAMGVDISTDALRVAIKNMETLGEQRRVIFRKSDVFSGLRPIDKFDIIVSNPPYIPISARLTLQNEVKNFDPDLALFAPDKDGVEFYKRILEGAKKHLKPNGYVLFEIGFTNSISQAPIVSALGEQNGFKLEFIEKDLAGIERVMCFCAQ